MAHEAGAGRLVLVHLPADPPDLTTARALFAETELGEDGGAYEF